MPRRSPASRRERRNVYRAGADHGAVDVPMVGGRVVVEPGGIVPGDDGVVVVAHAVAAEAAAAGDAYLERETAMREVPAGEYEHLRGSTS